MQILRQSACQQLTLCLEQLRINFSSSKSQSASVVSVDGVKGMKIVSLEEPHCNSVIYLCLWRRGSAVERHYSSCKSRLR